MEITYDPIKNQRNITERNLPFDLVSDFDFAAALIWQDTRKTYPEIRFSALGLMDGRVHSLVFTETPTGIRIISFRKANKREVQRYETES